MLYHTFKQIFRSLWRHKSFTIINLLGLSVGIAAVVVIFLIVRYEKSFDSFHSDSSKLYRIVRKIERADGIAHHAVVPYPTARFLREEQQGIVATQIHFSSFMSVGIGSAAPIEEKNIVFADSLFFKVLNYGGVEDFFVAGNPNTALSQPGQAILTESTAHRYFGKQDVIGQLLRLDNKVDVEVVGVVKDLPPTSHLPFGMLVSFSTLNSELMYGSDPNNWGFINHGFAYVRLGENTSRASVENALQGIMKKNEVPGNPNKASMHLQPLAQIHFDPNFEDSNKTHTVSPIYLTMLMLLAGFIMMIACVNYINLSTSLAFTKSKEVGIKKTLGASKGQLFFHYMLETFTLTVSAALFGSMLAVGFLPLVNQILNKSISISPLLELPFLLGAFGAILLISFISGAYPALVLSGFNPITSLKNQLAMPGKSSVLLSKGLVVFQFATAIALIICTILIARQMQYFQNKEMGFNKEAVVEVRLPERDTVKLERFKSMLQRKDGIAHFSFCLGAPISDYAFEVVMKAPELAQHVEHIATVIPCDRGYLETYQLELLAGRWLLPSEEINIGSAVVVNRTLANTLGYTNPEDAIGKTIELTLDGIRPTIVGVTEDFHTASLHETINSVAMTPFPYFHLGVGIRLSGADMGETLAAIEESWKQVYPGEMYEMNFVDETLATQYEQEVRDYQLFKAFSVISIFICCIGLWGLIAFVVVRKTKEIGIRRVLGASVSGIMLLLSKDFLKLVVIALLIASPVSAYFMHQWLQDFAYRIDISWWVFALAGLLALMIAFTTISYQAFKAAMANPVKSIKVE